MAVKTTRTAVDASAGAAEPGESRTVVGVKGRSRCVKELRTRNNHDIERAAGLVAAKELPNDALRPVAPNGVTQFPGGGNPYPGGLEAVREDEKRHEPPANPIAPFIDLLKLGAASYPLAS